MPVESATDRAAFFNVDEFGAAATYTRGGAATALAGIFDRPFVAMVDGEGGFGVGGQSPSFQCAESDLPADAAEGDLLTIATAPTPGATGVWRVVGAIERDGTGLATLRLERAS